MAPWVVASPFISALAVSALSMPPATVGDIYAGRSVRLIVGSGSGGDLSRRAVRYSGDLRAAEHKPAH